MKMKKMRKGVVAAMMLLGLVVAPVAASISQAADSVQSEQGGMAEAAAKEAVNDLVDTLSGKKVDNKTETKKSLFVQVVFGSGVLGTILWVFLFLDGAAAIYFTVDSFVLVSAGKLMPFTLVNNVQGAVAEGDVMKAIKACEAVPSPMANILAAAFQHVEDGYDVIRESVNAAADLEIERIVQRLSWISVFSNLGPSLGLLGTVQGMILCFATLASGVPDIGALAGNISQALWTTAAGLIVSVPFIIFYYILRNLANRLILRMTALTMELIKPLRNVEIEAEA
jgi:biopolymer transport protein ExbB